MTRAPLPAAMRPGQAREIVRRRDGSKPRDWPLALVAGGLVLVLIVAVRGCWS